FESGTPTVVKRDALHHRLREVATRQVATHELHVDETRLLERHARRTRAHNASADDLAVVEHERVEVGHCSGRPMRTATPGEECTIGAPAGCGSPAAASNSSWHSRAVARRNGHGSCHARANRWPAPDTLNNVQRAVRK